MEKKPIIWLIKEAEPVPIDGQRVFARTGLLAEYLSKKDYQVLWWSSTFYHIEKVYKRKQYTEIQASKNEKIALLHSPVAYKKNISIKRILYNKLLARELKKHIYSKEQPDIIICCWPIPELAKVAVEYGEKRGVPVVIDVRDMWPDFYARVFPPKLQKIADKLLFPFKRNTEKIFKKAVGISGTNETTLNFGCKYAGRKPGRLDRAIPISKPIIVPNETEHKDTLEWLQEFDITNETWNICFLGTLSNKSLDLDTVIQAIKILTEKYPQIRLVVGGKGTAEEYYKEIAKNFSNIVFLGYLNPLQMSSVMKISKCGLYCMNDTEDFRDAFSNKAIQYLSAGLPVITSLSGFSKTYIEKGKIGIYYKAGDWKNCSEQIEKIYLNDVLRNTMAENAYKQYQMKYNINIINEQWEDYIKQILKKEK